MEDGLKSLKLTKMIVETGSFGAMIPFFNLDSTIRDINGQAQVAYNQYRNHLIRCTKSAGKHKFTKSSKITR